MKFRPCIDIHNGSVKQLVGGSLKDEGNQAKENFVADQKSDYYASMYKKDGLSGGHIIILNHKDSEYFEQTKAQAELALSVYPGGMQIGGGINADNAKEYIEAGASHVIVTSYVFSAGKVNYDNLKKLVDTVGKERVVLDLSCRRKGDKFYVVTDRWQKFTDLELNEETMEMLSQYCDEFLIHGVDVEGKGSGMDERLVKILADTVKNNTSFNPITYAGGISSFEDIEKFAGYSEGKIDFTIGSALDIFGGHLSYKEVVERYN
ncbi:MAG: phosphoribosylformimino-5-aminoimidazole carboxamide ribotide isomerase [Lachnospiraceae bacterium]|nr:phosphoribosylformimino-5-aminoimidazole carboxamide ribotide isomerase [Lachnospiraceae bacterium]